MGDTPYRWCVGGSIHATYLRRDVNDESDEIHMVLCKRAEWSGNGIHKVGNTCKSCCGGIWIDRVTIDGRMHERLKLVKCAWLKCCYGRRLYACPPLRHYDLNCQQPLARARGAPGQSAVGSASAVAPPPERWRVLSVSGESAYMSAPPKLWTKRTECSRLVRSYHGGKVVVYLLLLDKATWHVEGLAFDMHFFGKSELCERWYQIYGPLLKHAPDYVPSVEIKRRASLSTNNKIRKIAEEEWGAELCSDHASKHMRTLREEAQHSARG